MEDEYFRIALRMDIVQDRIVAIFQLRGAVDTGPPLLIPSSNPDENSNQAMFVIRHGDIVTLPNNALVPFVRLAARSNLKRSKRYHITNIYRPNTVPGHPEVTEAAALDIITPDVSSGLVAAGAEMPMLLSNCLQKFPNPTHSYEIHIFIRGRRSHSKPYTPGATSVSYRYHRPVKIFRFLSLVYRH
ncbi:hypothetical protein BV22DRAFT_941139 [Leucogyrophana mollusca]|uniref:Uncharacterized protein n=1 Tax=Leucogyrophana mollusca TaxID=85980 RepID=A0ACB8AV32_9AGAM|nr:hypothetical protein BV22DRAFT_941139 [Leucogyrophana mollusca]